MKVYLARISFLCAFCFCQALYSTIYVFGDSHSWEFYGIRECEIRHLGGILMHRIGRDGLGFLDLKSQGVEEGSTVIYAFGEIDVRCHIIKQRDLKSRDLNEIINLLAGNYIKTILENQSHYMRLRSIIYNVIPPTDATNTLEYPIYGSLKARVQATKYLNATLKSLAEKNGIQFLDAYSYYEDKDGSLRPELSDGTVHIDFRHNGFIRKKLHQLLKTHRDLKN